jgi:hypothetical protein
LLGCRVQVSAVTPAQLQATLHHTNTLSVDSAQPTYQPLHTCHTATGSHLPVGAAYPTAAHRCRRKISARPCTFNGRYIKPHLQALACRLAYSCSCLLRHLHTAAAPASRCPLCIATAPPNKPYGCLLNPFPTTTQHLDPYKTSTKPPPATPPHKQATPLTGSPQTGITSLTGC